MATVIKTMEYVAAIDIGTTNLKCQIFTSDFRIVGSSLQKVCTYFYCHIILKKSNQLIL